MNTKVDIYLADGCRRCSLVATPACKVNSWREELKQLRRILLECGLTEELKWKVPCYTFQENNVLLMFAFKEFCAISFIKGVLLSDTNEILKKQGENSQSSRIVPFTNVQEVLEMESILKTYIYEAIEVEKAGLKVDFKEKTQLVFSEELIAKFEENAAFKMAFEALTLGRQRAYNLYFTAPKQSKTRTARIEKYVAQILEGKGFNEKYSVPK